MTFGLDSIHLTKYHRMSYNSVSELKKRVTYSNFHGEYTPKFSALVKGNTFIFEVIIPFYMKWSL